MKTSLIAAQFCSASMLLLLTPPTKRRFCQLLISPLVCLAGLSALAVNRAASKSNFLSVAVIPRWGAASAA